MFFLQSALESIFSLLWYTAGLAFWRALLSVCGELVGIQAFPGGYVGSPAVHVQALHYPLEVKMRMLKEPW